jgi:ribosomal protein S18 acetylase RimI-like enzyme
MPQPAAITIREATTPEDLATARTLLREYAAYLNASLGAEHICLHSYEKELANLPGLYAPPGGTLLVAFIDNQPAGCGALKPLTPTRTATPDESACEMKRLWVRPQHRGHSLGKQLAESLLERAGQRNYTAIYLDTIPDAMPEAHRLYTKLGFEPVEQYAVNLVLGEDTKLDIHFYRRSL